MSDTSESTNKVEGGAAAPPKGKKKLLIVALALLLLLGGGGGGAYFFLFHAKAAEAADGDEKKGRKKSKTKASKDSEEEEADEEEAGAEEGGEKAKDESDEHDGEKDETGKGKKSQPIELSLPEDSEVKSVVELQPFIINLADENEARYLRLTVSLGLGEGGEEEKPDPLFTTRVRNAMLAVLTTKTSEEILTSEGKNRLRHQLLLAAREASEEPHVEAIYITDFIVQL
ncbi:MAG: flagellar basal body-associated FliL family protein [Pyrinomonadaceae bacterium]